MTRAVLGQEGQALNDIDLIQAYANQAGLPPETPVDEVIRGMEEQALGKVKSINSTSNVKRTRRMLGMDGFGLSDNDLALAYAQEKELDPNTPLTDVYSQMEDQARKKQRKEDREQLGTDLGLLEQAVNSFKSNEGFNALMAEQNLTEAAKLDETKEFLGVEEGGILKKIQNHTTLRRGGILTLTTTARRVGQRIGEFMFGSRIGELNDIENQLTDPQAIGSFIGEVARYRENPELYTEEEVEKLKHTARLFDSTTLTNFDPEDDNLRDFRTSIIEGAATALPRQLANVGGFVGRLTGVGDSYANDLIQEIDLVQQAFIEQGDPNSASSIAGNMVGGVVPTIAAVTLGLGPLALGGYYAIGGAGDTIESYRDWMESQGLEPEMGVEATVALGGAIISGALGAASGHAFTKLPALGRFAAGGQEALLKSAGSRTIADPAARQAMFQTGVQAIRGAMKDPARLAETAKAFAHYASATGVVEGLEETTEFLADEGLKNLTFENYQTDPQEFLKNATISFVGGFGGGTLVSPAVRGRVREGIKNQGANTLGLQDITIKTEDDAARMSAQLDARFEAVNNLYKGRELPPLILQQYQSAKNELGQVAAGNIRPEESNFFGDKESLNIATYGDILANSALKGTGVHEEVQSTIIGQAQKLDEKQRNAYNQLFSFFEGSDLSDTVKDRIRQRIFATRLKNVGGKRQAQTATFVPEGGGNKEFIGTYLTNTADEQAVWDEIFHIVNDNRQDADQQELVSAYNNFTGAKLSSYADQNTRDRIAREFSEYASGKKDLPADADRTNKFVQMVQQLKAGNISLINTMETAVGYSADRGLIKYVAPEGTERNLVTTPITVVDENGNAARIEGYFDTETGEIFQQVTSPPDPNVGQTDPVITYEPISPEQILNENNPNQETALVSLRTKEQVESAPEQFTPTTMTVVDEFGRAEQIPGFIDETTGQFLREKVYVYQIEGEKPVTYTVLEAVDPNTIIREGYTSAVIRRPSGPLVPTEEGLEPEFAEFETVEEGEGRAFPTEIGGEGETEEDPGELTVLELTEGQVLNVPVATEIMEEIGLPPERIREILGRIKDSRILPPRFEALLEAAIERSEFERSESLNAPSQLGEGEPGVDEGTGTEPPIDRGETTTEPAAEPTGETEQDTQEEEGAEETGQEVLETPEGQEEPPTSELQNFGRIGRELFFSDPRRVAPISDVRVFMNTLIQDQNEGNLEILVGEFDGEQVEYARIATSEIPDSEFFQAFSRHFHTVRDAEGNVTHVDVFLPEFFLRRLQPEAQITHSVLPDSTPTSEGHIGFFNDEEGRATEAYRDGDKIRTSHTSENFIGNQRIGTGELTEQELGNTEFLPTFSANIDDTDPDTTLPDNSFGEVPETAVETETETEQEEDPISALETEITNRFLEEPFVDEDGDQIVPEADTIEDAITDLANDMGIDLTSLTDQELDALIERVQDRIGEVVEAVPETEPGDVSARSTASAQEVNLAKAHMKRQVDRETLKKGKTSNEVVFLTRRDDSVRQFTERAEALGGTIVSVEEEMSDKEVAGRKPKSKRKLYTIQAEFFDDIMAEIFGEQETETEQAEESIPNDPGTIANDSRFLLGTFLRKEPGVSFSENFPAEFRQVVQKLLDSIGFTGKISIVTRGDMVHIHNEEMMRRQTGGGTFLGTFFLGSLDDSVQQTASPGSFGRHVSWGDAQGQGPASYIVVTQKALATPEQLIDTLAHEIGHAVDAQMMTDPAIREAIYEEYRKILQDAIDRNITIREYMMQNYSPTATKAFIRERTAEEMDMTLQEMRKVNPRLFDYLLSPEEWIAQQFSGWAAGKRIPKLSVTGKIKEYFTNLKNKLLKLFNAAQQEGFLVNQTFENWLESLGTDRQESSPIQTVTANAISSEQRVPVFNVEAVTEQEARAREENAREIAARDTVLTLREDKDTMGLWKEVESAVRAGSTISQNYVGEKRRKLQSYEKAFAEALSMRGRTISMDVPGDVIVSYATAGGLFPDTWMDRLQSAVTWYRNSWINDARRRMVTPIVTRVGLVVDRHPELQVLGNLLDRTFASPDRGVQGNPYIDKVQQETTLRTERLAEVLRPVYEAFGVKGHIVQQGFGKAKDLRAHKIPETLRRIAVLVRDEALAKPGELDQEFEGKTMRDIVQGVRQELDSLGQYAIDQGVIADEDLIKYKTDKEHFFPRVYNREAIQANFEFFREQIVKRNLERVWTKAAYVAEKGLKLTEEEYDKLKVPKDYKLKPDSVKALDDASWEIANKIAYGRHIPMNANPDFSNHQTFARILGKYQKVLPPRLRDRKLFFIPDQELFGEVTVAGQRINFLETDIMGVLTRSLNDIVKRVEFDRAYITKTETQNEKGETEIKTTNAFEEAYEALAQKASRAPELNSSIRRDMDAIRGLYESVTETVDLGKPGESNVFKDTPLRDVISFLSKVSTTSVLGFSAILAVVETGTLPVRAGLFPGLTGMMQAVRVAGAKSAKWVGWNMGLGERYTDKMEQELQEMGYLHSVTEDLATRARFDPFFEDQGTATQIGKALQKSGDFIQDAFYRISFIEQITRTSQIGSAYAANQMVRDMVGVWESDATLSKAQERELVRLGFTDDGKKLSKAKMNAYAAFYKGLEESRQNDTREKYIQDNIETFRGTHYQVMSRMMNQMITRPNNLTRTVWGNSNHPLLRAMYRLNSFQHGYRAMHASFFLNEAVERFREGENWGLAQFISRFLPLIILSMIGVVARSEIGEWIHSAAGNEKIAKRIKTNAEERSPAELIFETFDKSGLLLQSGQVTNAVQGLRYGDSVFSVIGGVTASKFERGVEDLMRTGTTGDPSYIVNNVKDMLPGANIGAWDWMEMTPVVSQKQRKSDNDFYGLSSNAASWWKED